MINKGVYKHNKSGDLYEVIGTALHTETQETVVIYKNNDATFVRPLLGVGGFLTKDKTTKKDRFSFVG